MVARQSSQEAELPEIELLGDGPERRSPLRTFGLGLAALVCVVALALVGSPFLIESEGRQAGISIALTPRPSLGTQSADEGSARQAVR